MKFKRILAVVLSALMLTSMVSFTVSAKEDAELAAEPLLAYTTATNQGKLVQNKRALTSIPKYMQVSAAQAQDSALTE